MTKYLFLFLGLFVLTVNGLYFIEELILARYGDAAFSLLGIAIGIFLLALAIRDFRRE